MAAGYQKLALGRYGNKAMDGAEGRIGCTREIVIEQRGIDLAGVVRLRPICGRDDSGSVDMTERVRMTSECL